jgi:putative hydrolase of the HAD superfamily
LDLSAINRSTIDIVFLDAAGTLISLTRPVGRLYLERAQCFGFSPFEETDSAAALNRSFYESFNRHQPMAFPNENPAHIVTLERRWWRQVVTETFSKVGEIEDFDGFFGDLYSFFQTEAAWQLEPGCRLTLESLALGGFRTGVISNFDSRLEAILGVLDVRTFLDPVVVSSLAPAPKPDPAIFEFALHQAGVSADRALHIGDSLGDDYLGAGAAGLKVLLYDPKGRARSDSNIQRIDRLADLSALLL